MEAQNNNSDNLHYLGSKNNKNSTKIKNIGDLEMGLLSWFKKSKKNVAAASLAAAISAGAMTPDSAQAYQECSGSIANTQIPIIDSICDDNLKNVYLNINKGKYDAAMVELRRETNIHKLRHEPGYYLAISKLPKKVLHDPGNRLKLKITTPDLNELEKKNPALAYFARGIINDLTTGEYNRMRPKMLMSSLYSLKIDFEKDKKNLEYAGFRIEGGSHHEKISKLTEIFYKTLNENDKFEFFFQNFVSDKIRKLNPEEIKLFNESIGYFALYSNDILAKEIVKLKPILQEKLKANESPFAYLREFVPKD